MGQSFHIDHPIIHIRQHTAMSCWSAAAGMVLGIQGSVGAGGANYNDAEGLVPNWANLQTFADAHGFRIYRPQSWSTTAIVDMLHRSPLMVIGAFPQGHAIVVGGAYGDGTPTGTNLKIHDPAANGHVTGSYQRLMDHFPLATVHILHL